MRGEESEGRLKLEVEVDSKALNNMHYDMIGNYNISYTDKILCTMQHVTFLSSKLPIEFGFVEMRWWWMVSGVAFIGVKVLSFANSHFLRPILVSTPTKQSTTGPYDQRIVECATSINAERRLCGGAGKFPQQSCYSIAENTILHLHHGQSLYTQHCDVYVYATDTGASTDSSTCSRRISNYYVLP